MSIENPIFAGELAEIPKARLDALFGDSQGQWLYELAFGIDTDEARLQIAPMSADSREVVLCG